MILIKVTASAEKLKSQGRFSFTAFRGIGTFERDSKLTPKDLFSSKPFLFLQKEIQYEFMDIHWLFDEQKSTTDFAPCHHENALAREKSQRRDGNHLIYWFDVRSQDKVKKLVIYKAGRFINDVAFSFSRSHRDTPSA